MYGKNMSKLEWCERRDSLDEISNQLADVLLCIGRIKREYIADKRFYDAMTEVGKTIYAQYHKTLDEMIVCNVEIDRQQKPKD